MVVLLVLVALLACAAPAQAEVKWLCLPGAADNPCREPLGTTVYEPDGTTRVIDPLLPDDPPVDCFYVYPTVSEQMGPNANKDVDPEIRAIAQYQAQRFSQHCKVYAPVYRQITLSAIATGGSQTEEAAETAYADVREAWLEYLARFNAGRGVILIGHSQGTRMLRALIRREIDANADVRRRVVSAFLLGGNVLVKRGATVGGDFAHLPTCERPRQTGCVVAWSAFMDPPPDNSRYGRPPTSAQTLGLPHGTEYEVVCTDPETLTGGTGEITSYIRSERYPGFIGLLLLVMYGGPPPTAPTPWLQPAERYSGKCVTENEANVLKVTPIGSARHLNPSPEPTWGLHLGDVNLAFGELETIAAAQADAHVAAVPAPAVLGRPRVRLARARRGYVVTVTVRAPSGSRVRIVVRRGRATVARRTVTARGSTARLRLRVRRAGRYRASAQLATG